MSFAHPCTVISRRPNFLNMCRTRTLPLNRPGVEDVEAGAVTKASASVPTSRGCHGDGNGGVVLMNSGYEGGRRHVAQRRKCVGGTAGAVETLARRMCQVRTRATRILAWEETM